MMEKNFSALFLISLVLFSGCVQEESVEGIKDHIPLEETTSTTESTTSTTATSVFTTTSTQATSSTTTTTTSTSTTLPKKETLKVEVVYFHPSQPCENCIKVGQLAQETVERYFPSELSSGKVVFLNINLADPKNAAIVRKYGAASSSIWIGTYKGDVFHKEQKAGVWYKTGDPEEYMNYLRTAIEFRLTGDLS